MTWYGFGGFDLYGLFMVDLMMDKKSDQFSEQETQQRFQRLVKVALNTRPKPIKSMAPKGVPAQSKKQRKRVKRAA